ncbi:hypothetical protein [Salinarimonas sp.]|uniref:hypothetical protein n=1 Tax=Salinarimonas sp. TaxID=2766526 RepID=UPI0032D9241C
MTKITHTLAAAAVALATSFSPALAYTPDEVTLYDQPQQQDGFFKPQARTAHDVDVTGSIRAPLASGGADFWEAREAIRKNAEDHS